MSTSRISLIRGDSRHQNITQALDAIEADMDLTGTDQILVKPNLVVPDCPLAVTHVDAVRAVLEWLRARTDRPIVVGEGTAMSNTWEAFENYSYLELPNEYEDVQLMDLNSDETVELTAFNWRLRPLQLTASRTANQCPLRISVAPPKTHDTVLITLSLKNMIMGGLVSRFSQTDGNSGQADSSPFGRMVLAGEAMLMALPDWIRHRLWVIQAKELAMSHFTPSSKTAMHQGFAAMHLNLFAMAPYLFPHLAVIDGFEAMEGNGPTDGDKVDWRVALASTDWLAADVTAARMMGFSVEEIGYLHYCTKANYG